MYYSSLWMVKVAFISTYFGVAINISKWLRYPLYTMMAIVFASYIVIVLTSVFSCRSFSVNWLVNLTLGTSHPPGRTVPVPLANIVSTKRTINDGDVVPRCQMSSLDTYTHATALNVLPDLLSALTPAPAFQLHH